MKKQTKPAKQPGKEHGQKPPTPACPERQRYQLAQPTGKKSY